MWPVPALAERAWPVAPLAEGGCWCGLCLPWLRGRGLCLQYLRAVHTLQYRQHRILPRPVVNTELGCPLCPLCLLSRHVLLWLMARLYFSQLQNCLLLHCLRLGRRIPLALLNCALEL